MTRPIEKPSHDDTHAIDGQERGAGRQGHELQQLSLSGDRGRSLADQGPRRDVMLGSGRRADRGPLIPAIVRPHAGHEGGRAVLGLVLIPVGHVADGDGDRGRLLLVRTGVTIP
jgi:hypothetical protein